MRHRARWTLLALLALAAACGGDADRTEGDAPGSETPADSTPAAAPDPGAPTDPGTPSSSDDSSFASIRAAVCDTLDNSFDCARAVEARQLPASERVARRGDTLLIALGGGDTLRLADRDTGRPASREYHSFQARWPDHGLVLVQKQYYEGSEFLLIAEGTGDVTRLPDWPILSPDGDRFAVLSLDLVAGYGPNTLQLWAFEDGEPKREWETEPSQWGPRDGRWLSPDTLRFVQHGFCDQLGREGRGMCDRPAELFREGDTWHLRVGDETS
jgi:hypothetical protein